MGHHSFIQAEGGTLVESQQQVDRENWFTLRKEKSCSLLLAWIWYYRKSITGFKKAKKNDAAYKEEMGAHIDTKKIGMFDYRLTAHQYAYLGNIFFYWVWSVSSKYT